MLTLAAGAAGFKVGVVGAATRQQVDVSPIQKSPVQREQRIKVPLVGMQPSACCQIIRDILCTGISGAVLRAPQGSHQQVAMFPVHHQESPVHRNQWFCPRRSPGQPAAGRRVVSLSESRVHRVRQDCCQSPPPPPPPPPPPRGSLTAAIQSGLWTLQEELPVRAVVQNSKASLG